MNADKPSRPGQSHERSVDVQPDETPEYPLSAPIKPDDPERRTEQSRRETLGPAEEPRKPDRA